MKGAILLERRGKSFYEQVARQTSSSALREIFTTLAREEDRHAQVLADLFRQLAAEKEPASPPAGKPADIAGSVLTDKVREEIAAASFEAAAIYAAMGLEERSAAFYRDQEAKAGTEAERQLYRWLADWERSHLELLMALDEDLRHKVWHDRHFWPF
ncbi:MAG: ferritin-like domain-containing protein [Candidatus Bipolaricaulaceae bacterium]